MKKIDRRGLMRSVRPGIDIYRFPEDFISATATAATDEYFHAVRISDVDFVNITMPSSALADLDVVSS